MAGKYTAYWEMLKAKHKVVLVCETRSVKTIKKLISREKEKDLAWQLACKEFNNDSWLIKNTLAPGEPGKTILTLELKRRPLSI